MKKSTGRFPSFYRSRIVLCFLLLVPFFGLDAQTFSPTNVYNGWNSSTQVFATVPAATGLTFSQVARGAGLTAPATVTSGITSSGWYNQTSEATATAANKYFFFSITANATTSFTVSSLLLSMQRSSTGPSDFQAEYSINGGGFVFFGTAFNSTVNGTFVQLVTPSVAISIPNGGNVVFRIVGWNSTNASGTCRINNNTAINGTYSGVAPTLTTTGVTGAPFCVSSTSGAPATVSFSCSSAFSAGNTFTAQISDAAGSFASPVTIGTLAGTMLTGTINATIPAGTLPGTGYRIRVVASNPAVIGSDNGGDLTVLQGVGLSHVVTNVTCNGAANGSIVTTISEGVSPYTFAWSNSATTPTISALSPGTYSLTVTASNGCTGTIASATITEPAVLTASATATDIPCNGGNNGSVNLTVNGGTAPYTYAWSNSASTEDLSSLAPGTYSVTITDNRGCTQTATATVTEPGTLTASAAATNVLCNGGTTGAVTLTVNGGTTPYSYAWSNSATSQNLSAIAAGTYSVTITDSHGCTQTASATVTEPTAIGALAIPSNANCSGGNGSVSLSVGGGVAPYTYLWSTSGTTQNLSNVATGTYSVTITDNNGCTQTASATVTAPAAINASATAADAPCNGGSNGAVNLTVNGGIAPYTYAWSNTATTQNISALAAGTYSVTITDNNGCSQTASATVTEPAAINASANATAASCNGATNGGVTLTVNGGTAPYTYAWSNSATSQNISALTAGTYSVTIMDNNGCTHTASATVTEPAVISASAIAAGVSCNGGTNGGVNLTVNGGTAPYTFAWNNSATTEDISALAAGTYSVTITDNNGCTQTASVTVTQPAVLSVSGNATDVSCNGGTNGGATLTVNGGTAPYSYSWSNSANTQNISAIAAGTYSVIITDDNGCTQTTTVTVTEPAAVSSTIVSTDASCGTCPNGSADLTVSGGVGPYTYSWSNSATTEDITSVLTGTYTVVITDANGCQHTDSILVDFSTGIVNAAATGTTVSVFPNPSNGENIVIRFTEVKSTGEPVTFIVTDVAGNEVYRENAVTRNMDGSFHVSLSLADGVYTFSVLQNDSVNSGRLIIVR